MKRENAEKIITEYTKAIFGFTMKRCKTIEDAEDLSQEIVLRAYRALLSKDDIQDASKFIWTIAHNALSNYYRDTSKAIVGVSVDEFADIIAAPNSFDEQENNGETISRLQGEIAYLSKLQRKIVIAYYFENRKQTEIAKDLGIPLGTVKWHLFEAKKELKRGIDMTRKSSELKFNPIKFTRYSINGSIGKKNIDEYLHSSLAQNICYSIRNKAKTINEIADDLGVSPVYVESEIEHLLEYDLVLTQKDKYLLGFIINEPTEQLLIMQNDMYKKAAVLFANDLYDELVSCGILDDEQIICGQTDEPPALTSQSKVDHNFILWTLIPYIAARSGEGMIEHKITFEEVAAIRADGGHNIVSALILPSGITLPSDYVHIDNWCGPMRNANDKGMLWQIDSDWSDRDSIAVRNFNEETQRLLSLFFAEDENGTLSEYEYAWLSQRGYVKVCGEYDGMFKAAWQPVMLYGKDINERLLQIGERTKRKYKTEFDELKAPYVKAVLDSTPPHLRKISEYEMQFLFHSDGWFLLHCIECLLKNGKLKEPSQEQRKALTTLILKLEK